PQAHRGLPQTDRDGHSWHGARWWLGARDGGAFPNRGAKCAARSAGSEPWNHSRGGRYTTIAAFGRGGQGARDVRERTADFRGRCVVLRIGGRVARGGPDGVGGRVRARGGDARNAGEDA